MNNHLIQSARKLRLSGLLTSLELRVQEATTHQLPHTQFLELIFQDELNVREQRLIEKRKKLACFRETKTLEDFDWSFNTSIKRAQIYDLAAGQFIRQRRDVLLIGPPGLGTMPGTGLCRVTRGFPLKTRLSARHIPAVPYRLLRKLKTRSVGR